MHAITTEIIEGLQLGFTMKEVAELLDVDYTRVYRVAYSRKLIKPKPHKKRRKKKAKKKVVPLWMRAKRKRGKKSKRQEPELHYDVYLRQKLLAEKIMADHEDPRRKRWPGRLIRQEPKASMVPSPMILLEPEFDWLDTRYQGDLSWKNLSWHERRNIKQVRERAYQHVLRMKERSKGRRKTHAEVEEEKALFDKGYTRTSWGWEAPAEEGD